MTMSDHERDYYARKFREELDRIDKNDAIVRAKTAESFMAVLHDVVDRVAPHLWDRMRIDAASDVAS